MNTITFITGNPHKADYLARFLGHDVNHASIDLDEIQSLDLKTIVEHKLKQAYARVKTPVLVEDVGLTFHALGQLPGPLIKWFLESMSFEAICGLLEHQDRSATAQCVFGYYDGEHIHYFEGSLTGRIAVKPAGDGGYGWDKIFIPKGFDVTRAELSEEDDRKTYMQIKPFSALKAFLAAL